MPAPSPLAIATSSLKRLVKEEASYDLEEKKQLADIKKLGASNNEEDENAEYQLKQLVSGSYTMVTSFTHLHLADYAGLCRKKRCRRQKISSQPHEHEQQTP